MQVLGESAKYAFCGLKRKRRDFERSVLKYVSIKIPALTHSGRKRRFCVNAPGRLWTRNQRGAIKTEGNKWMMLQVGRAARKEVRERKGMCSGRGRGV